MKSILEDIKTQNFKQAYLLYGEEAYLKHQYKNKLKNALLPEDDTMNFSRFEGKGTEIPKVIDLAETMPFFADRRVILLENTGFFKNKADPLAPLMRLSPVDFLKKNVLIPKKDILRRFDAALGYENNVFRDKLPQPLTVVDIDREIF